MRLLKFEAEQWLAKPVEVVFDFFSNARNLRTLIPPWLNFVIRTPGLVEMRAGALIDYRLKIHGIPLGWQTEITAWNPPHRFVDEQRRGPYKVWIHEHRFEPRDGGTLARDFVLYLPPGGSLMDRLFVRKDIERIFQFRREKLQELFGR